MAPQQFPPQPGPSIISHGPDTVFVSSDQDSTSQSPTHNYSYSHSSSPSHSILSLSHAQPYYIHHHHHQQQQQQDSPAVPSSPSASSTQLDDELQDLVGQLDQDYHQLDYQPSRSSQTHHHALPSRSSAASSPPFSSSANRSRSRLRSESNTSLATSLYSGRSSHPPRTSSLSQSSSVVPPLFSNTASSTASTAAAPSVRASVAASIKRKPLSATASSLATTLKRSSIASSTSTTATASASRPLPPLPLGATRLVDSQPSDQLRSHSSTPTATDSATSVVTAATAKKGSVSLHAINLTKPDTRFVRPLSVESPTLYSFAHTTSVQHSPAFHSADQHLTSYPQTDSRSFLHDPSVETTSLAGSAGHFSDLLSIYQDGELQSTPDASSLAAQANPLSQPDSCDGIDQKRIASTATQSCHLMSAPKPAPHLILETASSPPANASHPTPDRDQTLNPFSPSSAPRLNKPLPKSPAQSSPFSSILGWGNNTDSQSATDYSPIPSPETPIRRGGLVNDNSRPPPSTLLPKDSKTNAAVANPLGYCESYLSTPPPLAALSYIHLEEMEDELKAISSELAASIRREIDLEDLVDRLQDQVGNPQTAGKRTSDYFSDSGYSSAKLSDYDHSRDELEKIQRRSEQEKASIRLELTNKLQDERAKIRSLDQQVKELAERASRVDLVEINKLDAGGRLKDLENTCEDLTRKLAQERSSKTNFEDLLTALKGELQDACNERDNLRDEIVPQLRARVEGLEAEAANYASLTYESTKMQHQLQSLQEENSSLRDSAAGLEDIASRGGLARSDSLFRNQRAPISRKDSVKNAPVESREVLSERLKDVEAQRDALHSALKNLLERQELQNRENQKKIKILELERQRLLSDSPTKASFEKDISKLRTEVNVLRRRAEDAMEQKWQVEKGLGGLKMDLDRAEEEVNSLRRLLKERDILAVDSEPDSQGGVSSESLEKAYKELLNQYNESLDRIKKLENGLPDQDGKAQQILQRLEQSLNSALPERTITTSDVSDLQSLYDNLANMTAKNIDSERTLADELGESVARVEQLAAQVRSQLAINAELRQRLSDAVTHGDSDRKSNSDRIAGLQERLRSLEEQLVTAQTSSDERISHYEEEISKLKEAHNEQLRRVHEGGNVGIVGPRKGPLLNFASSFLNRTGDALAPKNLEEEIEMQKLRARVTELEKALADTDVEMQQVVSKMNSAQIEVLNLQEEREAAVRETKRLQGMLMQEQTGPFAGRLRALAVGA